MTVATLQLDLRVSHCPNARERRRLLQTILDRLRRSFNVALAEADGSGGPDRVNLVVATVGRTRREARETLERVAEAVAAHPRAEVLAHDYSEA